MAPLTFTPFAAGLNNQKLALLGLALAARARGSAVRLPALVDYALDQPSPLTRPLEAVLDTGAIAAGLSDFGVGLAVGEEAEALDPHAMIRAAGEALADHRRAGAMAPFDGLCRLLAAMRPAAPIAQAAARVAEHLGGRGIDTGCQMRIERDWRHWTQLHRADARVDPAERLYLDHRQIIAKIAATLPTVRALYVTCNEADLPVDREAIRRDAASHGVALVFRSDLPAATAEGPLAGAALDFAVALSLPRFIGHTRSSFFGLLGLSAHGEGRAVEHWLYNNRGDRLKRRTDHGAFVRPWAAANASPAGPAIEPPLPHAP